MRAHPRAGGENSLSLLRESLTWGSSPRGRGKRPHVHVGVFDHGLIPARAGKTQQNARHNLRTRAHPRAGGENVGDPPGNPGPPGSSPRGRGKRPPRTARPVEARLIPARAGKTVRVSREPSATRAHPRAGGENKFPGERREYGYGSSPRGRGKRSGRARSWLAGRLIPARAGKTPRRPASPSASRAHPRAGGENNLAKAAQVAFNGSSPRGRGKHQQVALGGRRRRLIPARAGKTQASARSFRQRRAHPRAGGENEQIAAAQNAGDGSSPRGRGKRNTDSGLSLCLRLIPARAGKTTLDDLAARGVHGSSPRGRGKLSPRQRSPRRSRLIPARAGKTCPAR